MKKYYPDGNLADASNVYGYTAARTLEQVLKQAGNNLTRDNIMKQAASLKDLELDTLLPGIKIATSANDFAPIEQVQLARFNGSQYELFGQVIGK
jgi:branched-chain amino acid transport system substrate-binding protein